MVGDTIWESSSFLDSENKKILNEIDARGKLCTPLHLSCHEEDGKLGIWLDVNEAHLLINPIDLFNSIFEDYSRLYVYSVVEDGVTKKCTFYIDIVKERYMYSWTLLHSTLPSAGRNYHKLDYYIETLIRVIQELSDSWTEDKELAYESIDLNRESLDVCVKQLTMKAVFPRFYALRANEVSAEHFTFKAKHDEAYSIGIGDRTYSTFCTQWDTDMEYVRHQLEEYVYGHKAHIKLTFDSSDTEIILEKESILDSITKVDRGQSYTYKNFTLVKIISNGFANMPTLVGYCDEKQMLTELYEGLLEFALMQHKEGETYGDGPCNIVAYNQIKSPIIESMLKIGWKRDYSTYEIRQQKIKDVLTIDPDFDYFISHADGTVSDYDDLGEILGPQFQVEGLKEWAEEIAPIVIQSETNKPYTKDWPDYHTRGLELARRLRAILPQDYDLWYRAPFEDKSGTIEKPSLILL